MQCYLLQFKVHVFLQSFSLTHIQTKTESHHSFAMKTKIYHFDFKKVDFKKGTSLTR